MLLGVAPDDRCADAIILLSADRYAAGEQGVKNMYAFATVIRWERE